MCSALLTSDDGHLDEDLALAWGGDWSFPFDDGLSDCFYHESVHRRHDDLWMLYPVLQENNIEASEPV